MTTAGYQYHSMDDLQRLGEKIRAKAIKVTMAQQESYEQAQREANNDQTRYETGQQTRSVNYNPPDGGRADDHGNLSAYVHDAYSQLPQMFTQFAVPDPATMQPAIDTFYQTVVTLQPSLEIKADGAKLTTPMLVSGAPAVAPVEKSIAIMHTHLKNWDGHAADAFEVYIAGLNTASGLQQQLAIDLANGLEAMAAIREAMLTDVWTIGNLTYKALDQLDDCVYKRQEVARLTIVGALTAVAYAATDGVAAVLVESVQSAATIMSSMATVNQPAEQDIEGATVPPILDSMATALNRVRAAVEEQERVVAQAMTKVSESLEHNREHAVLRAPYEVTTAASLPVAAIRDPGSRFGFYPD